MLRLKFHVSQTTDVEPFVLIDRILLKLKLVKYDIEEVTDKSVTFDDNPWVMRWRHEAAKRIDGGKFEINTSQERTLVTLYYHLKLLPWLLALVVMEYFTISDQVYEGAIFFAVFFPIILIVQIIVARSVAKHMLEETLTVDVSL